MSDVKLTPEQEAFVNGVLSGRNVLVDACVGSGKTTAIQELCRRAYGKRILYLTYNKLLKLDAQARIHMPGVQVQNYHGFAWGELARHGIRTGVSDILSNYMAARIQPYPIDLLVLDEYQDINAEIAGMLNWLKQCCPGMIIAAVGDMRQKLYDWTRMDVAKFISDYLGPDRLDMEFTVCFRLSAEHAKAIGDAWGRAITGVNPDLNVREVNFREAYRIASACDPKDLLFLGKKSGTAMMDMLNKLEEDCPDRFNKYTVWSKIMDHDGGATQPNPTCAVFTTYDGSKGMERDVCLVFDFTDDYWEQRLYPDTANPEIVRNIFLVAASRGKRQILFVNPNYGHDGLLEFDTIRQADSVERVRKRLFDISTMFDFKFAEDITDAHKLLEVKTIQKPGLEITAPVADGLIDLSPCIGIWTEASYFEGYDINQTVIRAQKLHPGSAMRYQATTGWSDERLILYAVALETGQARYVSQVSDSWMPQDVGAAIHRRLASYLPEDALVQQPCKIILNGDGYGHMELNGVCDVFYDKKIWELKFVSALTEVHALQLAGYLLASGMNAGLLFNVRTGELLEVKIKNRDEFADQVTRTITKGLARGVIPRTDRELVQDFATSHPGAFRDMELLAPSGKSAVEKYLADWNLAAPVPVSRLMRFFRTRRVGKTNRRKTV